MTGRLDRSGAIFPLSATARSGHGSPNGPVDTDGIAHYFAEPLGQ